MGGMDEDSNMSNISTASDSMDGLTQLTAKPEDKPSQPDGVKRMTMVSAEGGRYTGETNMEGKRQGRGEYIWPNNDRYMGDFADGVKNGMGFSTLPTETKGWEFGKMTSYTVQQRITTLWAGLMKKFGKTITRCQNGGGSRASPTEGRDCQPIWAAKFLCR